MFKRQTRLRNSQALGVCRVTLLAITLAALSMLHAANDTFAAESFHHGNQALSAIDAHSERCCSGRSGVLDVVHGEAGGHCPVYMPVTVALLAAENRADRFNILNEIILVGSLLRTPFRPPRNPAVT